MTRITTHQDSSSTDGNTTPVVPHERQGLLILAKDNNDDGHGYGVPDDVDEENPSIPCFSRGCSEVSNLSQDDDYNTNEEELNNKPDNPKWRRVMDRVDLELLARCIKYTYSLGLLAFSIHMIMAGIVAGQTPVAQPTHWSVAFSITCFLIIWLGLLEGGQGSLVGLQPIHKGSYQDSHPMAHQCTTMAHAGDNLNRFIVGRQFLVVLVVFGMNLCCSVVKDAVIAGFSPTVVKVVLESGLAVMLITVILGQLSAEVNATNCMLDFINTPFMLVTTWLCLAIESSGLLHSVYLVQYLFQMFSGKAVTSDESPRTVLQDLFFWVRVLVSFCFLGFACIITMSALVNEQTTSYDGIPDIASVAIFLGLVCFLGMMEAMQIALFAVVNLPDTDLDAHPTARDNCDLAFRGTNFQAFLIGRQICVTMCMFLLARITTTDVDLHAGEETVLGISNSVQLFFNTGLPGAFITTIVASLAWRIFASSFPIHFLANPLVNATIRLCLLLEASGVFSTAWLFAKALKLIVGFQLDEVYIGPLYKREHKNDLDIEKDDETVTLALSESSSLTDYGSTES